MVTQHIKISGIEVIENNSCNRKMEIKYDIKNILK